MRTLRRGLRADRLFVIAASFVISVGVTIIAAFILTVCAFTQLSTIWIPLVATFRGFSPEGGGHAVIVQGSWGGALVVVLLLAAPLCAVAVAYRRNDR